MRNHNSTSSNRQEQQHAEIELLPKRDNRIANIDPDAEETVSKISYIFKFVEFLFISIALPINLIATIGGYITPNQEITEYFKVNQYKARKTIYKFFINMWLGVLTFTAAHLLLYCCFSLGISYTISKRWKYAYIVGLAIVASLFTLIFMFISFYKNSQIQSLLNITLLGSRGFAFMSSLALLVIVLIESRKERNINPLSRSRRLFYTNCSIEIIMHVFFYLMIIVSIIASLSMGEEILDLFGYLWKVSNMKINLV